LPAPGIKPRSTVRKETTVSTWPHRQTTQLVPVRIYAFNNCSFWMPLNISALTTVLLLLMQELLNYLQIRQPVYNTMIYLCIVHILSDWGNTFFLSSSEAAILLRRGFNIVLCSMELITVLNLEGFITVQSFLLLIYLNSA